MIVGSVCLSHNPLMEKKRAAAAVEDRFQLALREARSFVANAKPDLTVVIFPDHLNGFFYDQLPCFCIGVQAESIGDYGTIPGPFDIPEAIALNCAEACIASSIDVNLSYRMKVDHGGAQPIENLSGAVPLKQVLPIFVNCVAHPRPSFKRAGELGKALGTWAQKRPERILFVGSGGLSHDPPLPSITNATPDVRARLIAGGSLSHAERTARQARILQVDYDAPDAKLTPLNPEWDRKVLEAFANGNLDFFSQSDDEEITKIAGSGAHELRTWVTALSALKSCGEVQSNILFYEPVKEWITGMGIMTAALND